MNYYSSYVMLATLFTYLSLTAARVPNYDEMMILLHAYFPTLNENTTVYGFLSDEKNVALLDRVRDYCCIDMKRKRKVRSLNWLWNEFTLPVNQVIINGTTFSDPEVYTVNSTEEQIYSKEGRFYNAYSPPKDAVTTIITTVDNITTVPTEHQHTAWPTDDQGNRIAKKNMRGIDYINMVNNDVDTAKGDLAGGGCPLGFGGN